MPFRSDPRRPGSDAWAGPDAASVATWNKERAWLRAEMLAIRRWTAATRTFGYTALRAAQARKRPGAQP
jgi:hypothetical protein